jgi:hypothetical protein
MGRAHGGMCVPVWLCEPAPPPEPHPLQASLQRYALLQQPCAAFMRCVWVQENLTLRLQQNQTMMALMTTEEQLHDQEAACRALEGELQGAQVRGPTGWQGLSGAGPRGAGPHTRRGSSAPAAGRDTGWARLRKPIAGIACHRGRAVHRNRQPSTQYSLGAH